MTRVAFVVLLAALVTGGANRNVMASEALLPPVEGSRFEFSCEDGDISVHTVESVTSSVVRIRLDSKHEGERIGEYDTNLFLLRVPITWTSKEGRKAQYNRSAEAISKLEAIAQLVPGEPVKLTVNLTGSGFKGQAWEEYKVIRKENKCHP